MKVFITDSAIRDLVAISDYIRPHNPDRAATFVDELLDQCEALAEFPQRYPLVSDRVLRLWTLYAESALLPPAPNAGAG